MDTKETLDWKLQQLTAKNIPMESGMADYIAFGMEGIENDIAQLTNYKALIEAQIKQAKENQGKVKIECAEWLGAQGLDKLEGLKVSSITVTKAVEESSESKVVDCYIDVNTDDMFNIKDLDIEVIEMLLLEHGYIENGKVKQTTTIKAKPAQIKVNQKRK